MKLGTPCIRACLAALVPLLASPGIEAARAQSTRAPDLILAHGTILTVDRITTPGVQQYVQSVAHYLDVAKKMKVDVEVQNHAIFDGMPDKLAALKTRKPGAQHPFIVDTDRYVKFWSIISECMQAEVARRPA